MQSHTHSYTKPESSSNLAANGNYYGQYNIYSRNTGSNSGRTGDTTHGKQKGVKYIIKVL